MTKIKKAKELIKEHGKPYAKEYFNQKLIDLMQVYDKENFSHVCEVAGLETVLNFIEQFDEETDIKS